MAAHTMADLYQMQSLPLDIKVRMTMQRIKGWVDEFGEDGVYISFSGGKDSTVLMDIIRNQMGLKNIPAVFVDVPTQYPELKVFAKTWDDVEIIRPKISFMEVCEKYGFPLISKEVSKAVYSAKIYMDVVSKTTEATKKFSGYWAFADMVGIPKRQADKNSEQYINLKKGIVPKEILERIAVKELSNTNKEKTSRYDKSKYAFLLFAKFDISERCCAIMKKQPAHTYHNKTGRKPITAQMAAESKLRTQSWIKNGCNGFNMTIPTSNPMSFWTEQDVLKYIKENNLPICSVYGEVVEDYETEGILENQITFDDFKCDRLYKTTGCDRTGCMLCGFGCHMSDDKRFLLLKETHPKMYGLLDVAKNNGVTFREAIEWTNEHGNLNIRL